MNRYRNKQSKLSSEGKLEEFPDDFDDVFFHNETVDQDTRIKVLRSIVYKKIKKSIIERVLSYKTGEFPLEDIINVEFDIVTDFSEFQWAVVREELLDRGFDAKFIFDENNKIKSLTVPIRRTISLTETLDEKEEREKECCNEESSSSDDDEI
jgi:hypothetical protein